MHHISPQARPLAIALLIASVVGACSVGSQAAGGAGTGDQTIAVAAPADGTDVSIPFDVRLSSSVALGAPETGDHHAHLYFDTDTNAADYDIVYGDSWTVTRPLSPGTHTIIAALANPDHSLAGPTQTFTVTVTGQAPGGGSSGAPAGSAPPAGY